MDDVNKLKKDLANKIEKIARLEFDLEAARDQIYELKQHFYLFSPMGLVQVFSDSGHLDDVKNVLAL